MWKHFAISILCKCTVDLNPRLIQIDTFFNLKGFLHAFQSLLLIFLGMGLLGQEDIFLSNLHKLTFL